MFMLIKNVSVSANRPEAVQLAHKDEGKPQQELQEGGADIQPLLCATKQDGEDSDFQCEVRASNRIRQQPTQKRLAKERVGINK